MYARKEKISHAYVSKNNSHREKQVIFLKIPNGEEWHYFAVKIPSTLLRRITSKHYGDFYCMNCLHSFRTKNKLESHKTVCENKDVCNVIMPSEDTKILELNQYQKYDKAPCINHADLECIIEKIDGCKKDPKNSSIQTKVREHIPPGFSMSTISSFRRIENKQYV